MRYFIFEEIQLDFFWKKNFSGNNSAWNSKASSIGTFVWLQSLERVHTIKTSYKASWHKPNVHERFKYVSKTGRNLQGWASLSSQTLFCLISSCPDHTRYGINVPSKLNVYSLQGRFLGPRLSGREFCKCDAQWILLCS